MSDGEPETRQIEPEFFEKLGRLVAYWALVEENLTTLLTACLKSDPGMTLMLAQSVSTATVIDWIRTMSRFGNNPDHAIKELEEILREIDELRVERNALVHGLWVSDVSDGGTAIVHTVRLHTTQPARDILVTPADLGELVDLTLRVNHRLSAFLARHGLAFS